MWPTQGAGMEDPPVLTVSTLCNGMCVWPTPPGFANVLVYGDGTVLVTRVTGELRERAVSLGMYSPSGGVLDGLYAAAEAAGLMAGGESVAGDGSCCADCGTTVFRSRLGPSLTQVSAPCLSASAADGSAVAQRALLRQVEGVMEQLIPAGEGESLAPTSYVLFVWGVGDHPADLEALGVDLADFVPFHDGSLCGIVPATSPIGGDIVALGKPAAAWVGFGDEVRGVYARGAYPHEHTCADIDD
jgi:hypothetical protein